MAYTPAGRLILPPPFLAAWSRAAGHSQARRPSGHLPRRRTRAPHRRPQARLTRRRRNRPTQAALRAARREDLPMRSCRAPARGTRGRRGEPTGNKGTARTSGSPISAWGPKQNAEVAHEDKSCQSVVPCTGRIRYENTPLFDARRRSRLRDRSLREAVQSTPDPAPTTLASCCFSPPACLLQASFPGR